MVGVEGERRGRMDEEKEMKKGVGRREGWEKRRMDEEWNKRRRGEKMEENKEQEKEVKEVEEREKGKNEE